VNVHEASLGEASEPLRERGNVALLLIDFQRDFCERGGYADQIADVSFARDVVPRARLLLHAARALGVCVVHTREGYAPDLSDCTLQRRLRSRRAGAPIGESGPLGRFLIRGEPGHGFVPALEPTASEIVIDKPSYGAFYGTALGATLEQRGIRHLYFTGVTADVCVHTTLREATDRGYFCNYVKDAISTFDAELRLACERMVDVEGGIWGRLTTTNEALAELDALGSVEDAAR
jgi:nicotinamidase-related amidase